MSFNPESSRILTELKILEKIMDEGFDKLDKEIKLLKEEVEKSCAWVKRIEP